MSAILPVYNGEEYLPETLESLVSQTYPSLEVIAVDDGSRDGSAAILDGYRERFGGRLLVLHIPNAGVSRARNLGVEKARGFYVAFIDQDDLWNPGKVARQVEDLRRSGARISFTNTSIIDGQGRIRVLRARRFPGGDAADWFERILFDPGIAISSVMMERGLFLEAGGFSPDLRISEDYDLLLRVLWKEKPVVRDEPCLKYRDHGASDSYRRTDTMIAEGLLVMGKWKSSHPEIFRGKRVQYGIFRCKLEFLRLKGLLQRATRRESP